MNDNSGLTLSNNAIEKLLKIKNDIDPEKNWTLWTDEFIEQISNQLGTNLTAIKTIENIFEKNLYEKYYDDWIRNFALNLHNIWNEPSVRDLTSTEMSGRPSIVIGRGPSIYKHKHLEMLAKSSFDGTIICTDGALVSALKAGVTPEKFDNFLVVTIDTQEHIKNLYDDEIVRKYGCKIKSILSTTVPISTYDIVKKNGMKIFWLHALFDYNKGKSSFNYVSGLMTKTKSHQKGLPAIQTGGNVGTSCWIISWSILKSSPVVLLGIDHGYPAEMPWEEIDKYHKIPDDVSKDSAVFQKAYPTIYNPEFNCYVKQDPIFQYYSNALKEFIPRAPSWVKTINATGGGAIFGEGIKCMKFEDFLSNNNYV